LIPLVEMCDLDFKSCREKQQPAEHTKAQPAGKNGCLLNNDNNNSITPDKIMVRDAHLFFYVLDFSHSCHATKKKFLSRKSFFDKVYWAAIKESATLTWSLS
jgi:hypothetical protein